MKVFFIKALRQLILSLFTALIFAGMIFASQMIAPKLAVAADGCTYVGQCTPNNLKCVCPGNVGGGGKCDPKLLQESSIPCGSAIIGGVEPPAAVANINLASGSEIGLIFFASRAITFINIVAGIIVMINFVIAGFTYVSSAGNSSEMSKINEKLMWSVIGILVIVGSYTIAAIFGLIFYG